MANSIEHILVLMLENRSFDHLLAYSGIPGLKGVDTTRSNPGPKNTTVAMSNAAPDRALSDPGHEFEDVDWQIYRAPYGPSSAANAKRPITLTGFVDKSGPSAMACAAPNLVPVFTHLAREFMVCDQWFSSMPGPTWPNRFFVHAGSSGGLANSPSDLTTIDSMLWSEIGFSFEHGTVYEALESASPNRTWRVYHGDLFPQVCAIDTMPSVFVARPDQFRPQKKLAGDLASGDVASYTFIEPDYGILSRFRNGDSQHPSGMLSAGEVLIGSVVQALMDSPVWQESLLFILYDEHGGFYDQLAPLAATPPGDDPKRNEGKAKNQPEPPFLFDRYGVRTPAVVVSPWVRPRSVWSKPCDHACVIRTVFDVFGLPGQLTERDGHAPSLKPALRGAPLTAAPSKLPEAPSPPVEAAHDAVAAAEPPRDEGALNGFTRIAALVHHALLEQQAAIRSGVPVDAVPTSVAPTADLAYLLNVPRAPNRSDADAQRAYIAQVAAEVEAHRQLQLNITP
jgi:phospholipase C